MIRLYGPKPADVQFVREAVENYHQKWIFLLYSSRDSWFLIQQKNTMKVRWVERQNNLLMQMTMLTAKTISDVNILRKNFANASNP
jgi:hypothetical protein